MPRRARLIIPDVPVHLIQRGHNKHQCFFAQRDFRLYLRWLEEFSNDADCSIHAYVLMTNHVHISATPHSHDSLSKMMKAVNQRYVAYINKAYNRTGTLWEGRFKSCLMQDVNYIITCQRYIELNPVRAGMVTHPGDYPWSSYRANADGRFDPRVHPHPAYLALGGDDQTRQLAYKALFNVAPDDSLIEQIRKATKGNYALGDQVFISAIAAKLGRAVTPGPRGRPPREPYAE